MTLAACVWTIDAGDGGERHADRAEIQHQIIGLRIHAGGGAGDGKGQCGCRAVSRGAGDGNIIGAVRQSLAARIGAIPGPVIGASAGVDRGVIEIVAIGIGDGDRMGLRAGRPMMQRRSPL